MQELRQRGYLPAAVRNYLALLGWGTEDDATILSTDELIERFSIDRVGRSSAIFDERKLRWLNGRFMRELPLDEYEQATGRSPASSAARRTRRLSMAAEPERRSSACEIVQDKAQTLDEAWPLIRFLFAGPADDAAAWERVMTPEARPVLVEALEALRSADGFDPASIEAALSPVVERSGRSAKAVYQPIRVAITGTTVSPGIFDSLAALGRDESLRQDRAGAEEARVSPIGAPPGADQGAIVAPGLNMARRPADHESG